MAAQAGKGRQTTTPEYECRRAASPIDIDGRGDEEAWRRAATVETFTAHWLDRPARSRTRARLLWDDDYLYFFADMDDVDLYADRTEHDDMIWLNDVFELFFKPTENELGYYEFQVNASNATLDMYLPSRGSGGYDRWVKADPFEFDSAVVLRGTLNDPKDKDQGWSVEGRIAWSGFGHSGGRPAPGDRWRMNLCRYDYSVAYDSPDLSSSSPLTRPDFHRYEDYGVVRFTGGDVEIKKKR